MESLTSAADSIWARQHDVLDQRRIAAARIVIVGVDTLGAALALGALALGVGEIVLVDDRRTAEISSGLVHAALREWPADGSREPSAARGLAVWLRALQPHARVRAVPVALYDRTLTAALPRACDAAIDATNNPDSQRILADWASRHDIALILAAADATSGVCSVASVLDRGDRAYRGQVQGSIPSIVMAGVALEEVRHVIAPLAVDESLSAPVRYALLDPQRAVPPAPSARYGACTGFDGRHVALVGAGGIGTWAALAIALSPGAAHLTVVDPDTIEYSNLNRQVLHGGAIGQPKARHLADRLEQLNPRLRATGVIDAVRAEHIQDADAVLACVDRWAPRRLLDQLGVPLVNGGSSAFGGAVQVSVAGHTACLNCSLGIDRLAADELAAGTSCVDVEASVVIPNMVIGGLLAGEALHVLHPDLPGALLQGTLEYDSHAQRRIGVRARRGACTCRASRSS